MRPDQHARRTLRRLYDHALAAVRGRDAVAAALRARPISGALTLIAIGKAAQSMAEGAIDVLDSESIRGGLVVSKPGHIDPDRLAGYNLETVVAGHPRPDAGSLEAGQRLLATIEAAGDTTLMFLVSGGASSLVELPVAGVGLAELERCNDWLLGSGLAIDRMNLVRKSLSLIKGGALLSHLGSRSAQALAISDVPGDDPAVIGSGLLVPEPELAERVYAIDLPAWLAPLVHAGLAERGQPPQNGPTIELVATLSQAKRAAADAATVMGLRAHLHDEFIEGDATRRGHDLARRLLASEPGLHIWGGETTVALPAQPGRGGRNQHLALSAAIELAGCHRCCLLCAGTDGTDGPTEDAGAIVDASTVERGWRAGLDVDDALSRADAGGYLAAIGDLLHTGPTGTNVMDLMLGLKQ